MRKSFFCTLHSGYQRFHFTYYSLVELQTQHGHISSEFHQSLSAKYDYTVLLSVSLTYRYQKQSI